MKTSIRPLLLAHKREGGYILLLVLVALVAMMVSGIALVRSMDTSQLVAGNLAARNATINSADAAVDRAVAWLQTQNVNGTLNNDIAASGYFAEDLEGNWIPAYNWAQCANCVWPDNAGNTVSYVIHRMTAAAGDPSGTAGQSFNTGGAAAGISQSSDGPTYIPPGAHYYRVTVQVRDARNTTTVVQGFIAI